MYMDKHVNEILKCSLKDINKNIRFLIPYSRKLLLDKYFALPTYPLHYRNVKLHRIKFLAHVVYKKWP